MGDDDSPALHAADTIRAGDGLCDEAAVRVLVEHGPRYVRELIEWGARFDLDARRPARRSAARRRTAFGACCMPATRPAAKSGACSGSACARCRRSTRSITRSSPSCSSTTGSSAASRYFDADGREPRGARQGDAARHRRCRPGVQRDDEPGGRHGRRHRARRSTPARAWRIWSSSSSTRRRSTVPGAPRFLISEALRGEGARLVNGRGEPFMTRYHPDGDLAPRDVVARSIVREAEAYRRPGVPHARAPRRRLRAATVSDDRRDVRAGRPRSRARSDPGRPRRALPDGRRRHRRVGADVGAGTVCGGRGCVHRRPRRESAGQQLAARGAGLRRARGATRCSSRRRRRRSKPDRVMAEWLTADGRHGCAAIGPSH